MTITEQTTHPSAEDIHISFDPWTDLTFANDPRAMRFVDRINDLEMSDEPNDWDEADLLRKQLDDYVATWGAALLAAADRFGYQARIIPVATPEDRAWMDRNTWTEGMNEDSASAILNGAWERCQVAAAEVM